MGKIILEFDSIEESYEARIAIDAMKWKMAIYDLDQKLRDTVKYNASLLENKQTATDEEFEIAESLRAEIRHILDGYGLSLND